MANFISSARFILFLIVLICCLNFLASYFGWYQGDSQIDKLYHALGGFWIGAVIVYINQRLGGRFIALPNNNLIVLIALLGGGALFGVFWEFFEFMIDTLVSPPGLHLAQGDLIDTMGDLACDLLGTFTFGLVYVKSLTSARKTS